MPWSNKSFILAEFFESFNFFDWAEKGRPNFLPVARILSNEDFVRWLIKLRSISADNPKAKAITLL